MKALSLSAILAFAVSVFAVDALAEEEPAPRVKLENGVSAIVEILFDESAEATVESKRDRIIATLDEKLTFHYLIRRTLGPNWSSLSPDQQREFARLITDLILRTYTRKLTKENKPALSFESPVELTPLRVEIPSRLTVRDRQVSMAYRMAKLKSGWELYDIHVRGISLSQNYRSQFEEYFQNNNAAALIQLIKDKFIKQ